MRRWRYVPIGSGSNSQGLCCNNVVTFHKHIRYIPGVVLHRQNETC